MSYSFGIIAMKGHPFTRKTEFAKGISASLRCPILSLDDFLDVLSPDHFQTSPSSNCAPQDLAFRIICQISKSHLHHGVFQNIVINSPLSSRSHLDQLIELAESRRYTKLIIVECKAYNTNVWQTNFAEYLKKRPSVTNKWYQPKSWEDVEKAIRDGYEEDRSDGYDKLPKLVIDPFSDYTEPDSLGLRDAITHMLTRNECDSPDVVEYHLWRQGQYLNSTRSSDNEGEDYYEKCLFNTCRAGSGHYITNYAEEGPNYKAECSVCESQVRGAAYTCKHCRFALHKECAELLDHSTESSGGPTRGTLESLLDEGYQLDYKQDSWRCSVCWGKEEPGSPPCGDCLFTTHLKKKVLPTVIRHDCDEHFLSIMIKALNPKEDGCHCKACGSYIGQIWYSCKTCGLDYHYKCLTEVAARMEHEHGGHHHHMSLRYWNPEAEDYLCEVCFEIGDPEARDPRRWFYSCDDCPYLAHLECIRDDRLRQDEHKDKEGSSDETSYGDGSEEQEVDG